MRRQQASSVSPPSFGDVFVVIGDLVPQKRAAQVEEQFSDVIRYFVCGVHFHRLGHSSPVVNVRWDVEVFVGCSCSTCTVIVHWMFVLCAFCVFLRRSNRYMLWMGVVD